MERREGKKRGKFNAAIKAVELVKDGWLIGIGSGTTVEVFLNELGKRIKEEELEIYGVPSSYQSHILAIKNSIRVVDLFQFPELDACFDGADQVDKSRNCIKGGGGALTREKIIAHASKKVYIMVDYSKVADCLNIAVPVEVLPFAYGFVRKKLSLIGKPILREGKGKLGPIITDNGNFILDCDFGEIKNPEDLETYLDTIPGVIESGIFSKRIIDEVIVGTEENSYIL